MTVRFDRYAQLCSHSRTVFTPYEGRAFYVRGMWLGQKPVLHQI
jgi:hypothetical protein